MGGDQSIGTEPPQVDPVDLLVFGPHPDDIEIGMGGTVARHAALGHCVGLCDLTAGEMGSNGTVDERLAEAEAARAVLGARWRVNLRLPDRALGRDPTHADARSPHWSGAPGREPSRSRTGPIGIPITSRASELLTEAIFNAGLRRFPGRGRGLEARRGSATTSSTITRRRRSSST